jgi:hypothetical protein
VKWSLCLISYAPRHEDVWGNEGIAPSFLTSALDGGDRSSPHPGRFTPGEKSLSIHRIGGFVSPRAGLDAVE